MKNSQQFINLETVSAKFLFGATLLALILSNSPWQQYYFSFFHDPLTIHFKNFSFQANFLFWINDALMTIFFLVVGLEIKFELIKGALNTKAKAALPAIAALGGMIIPACVYSLINWHFPQMLKGWAIPTATDIAFALAVLLMLGPKVPSSLKVFLTALAILDDLGAILIIAIFYSEKIALAPLFFVVLICILLFVLNKKNIFNATLFLILGSLLWYALFKSGIHPTLCGVILAMMVPFETQHRNDSPVKKIRDVLHPFVALGILPLFAFANAGVSLNFTQTHLHLTLILGILLGLFVGKQMGVFSASWLAVKLGFAALPDKIHWKELYAVSIICGIGFTISLFIGTLAFENLAESYMNSVKIGVLLGSLLSGIVGYLFLYLMKKV